MGKSCNISSEEIVQEWFSPEIAFVQSDCFVRLIHVPSGKIGIGASYIGNGHVTKRKNLNIAYRNLLMAMNQENENE